MSRINEVLEMVEKLEELLKKDLPNCMHEPRVVCLSNVSDEESKERQDCRNYLHSLSDSDLTDIETIMYVGKDIFQGFSCDWTKEEATYLELARKVLDLSKDHKSLEIIMSKKTICLLTYFDSYKKYIA